MREINRCFIPTSKKEKLDAFFESIPCDPNNGSLLMTNMDRQEVIRLLKKLSEPDESINPAMVILQRIFFSMPPVKAFDFLAKTMDNGASYFGVFMEEIIEYVQHWLHLNTELFNELIEICGLKKVQILEDGRIAVHDFKITAEDEQKFLQNSTPGNDDVDNKTLKRMKILAAIDIIDKHSLLNDARRRGDVDTASMLMFFIARSCSCSGLGFLGQFRLKVMPPWRPRFSAFP